MRATAGGARIVPLNDLGAGADGDADGATVWADHGIDHFASAHYVAVHELVTFAVIACGDVQETAPSTRRAEGDEESVTPSTIS